MIRMFLISLCALLLQKGCDAQAFAFAPANPSVAEGTTAATSIADLANGATNANGAVTYVLLGTQTDFVLNMAELRVGATVTLDFETTATYTLSITATDTTPTTLTATITVSLTDVNDNAPTFAQANGYSLRIANGAGQDTVAGTVTATDADSGVNANLVYSITSGNTDTTFKISNAGVISVDTGKVADDLPYALTIQAADQGSGPMTGTTNVYIVENDCPGAATRNVGIIAIIVPVLFQAVKFL